MWNLCASSKIIDNRIRQKSYQIHQQKLEGMRSKIKIQAPIQPQFVFANYKQEMSRRDRLMEIDHQNEILLSKMQKISKESYNTNKLRPEAQQLKTLNKHIQNVQAEEIQQQNRRICQKLLRVNSYYPTFDIIDNTDALQKVKISISENARRVQSAKSLRRPQSSLTYRSSKFYRSKVQKFDADGNTSDQKVFKLFQMPSDPNLRPDSAPSAKQLRPYSSQRKRPRRTHGDNAEEQVVGLGGGYQQL